MMAMYAGIVKTDGEWDDDTSLGALLDKKISALEFRTLAPDSEEPMPDEDIIYNKRITFQAQAEAIIEHLLANMEVCGITTKGDVSVSTSSTSAEEEATATGHTHDVSVSTTTSNVVFTQNNDGTGRIK
jgi:hypothetical protein